MRLFCIAVLVMLLGACATPRPAPSAQLRYWLPAVDAWERAQTAGLRLTRQDQSVVTVPAAVVRHLVAARREIETRSGVAARLAVIDMPAPNAIATAHDGQLVVALSLPWLNALGTDRDAVATTLGHEYAHHKLAHSVQARREREQAAATGSQVLGAILNVLVPYSGNLASLAITGFARGFTRDEERAADDLGLQWAMDAGYSPCGRVRTMQLYQRAGAGPAASFLSTHPGADERISHARQLAAQRGQDCATR